MKIRRNEVCHCGSGKKYKKCCGPKEASNVLTLIAPSTNQKGPFPTAIEEDSLFLATTISDDTYDQVLDMFEHILAEIDESPLTCLVGMYLWEMYIQKKQPVIKKIEGYAASLHYITILSIPCISFTQKELAKMYHTTPSFISSTSSQMRMVLREDLASLQELLQEEEPEESIPPIRMAGEKHMWELTQLLQENNCNTEEEIISFVTQQLEEPSILPTSMLSKQQQAQRLIYDAFPIYGEQRIQIAQQALQLDPYCVDAYNILGETEHDCAQRGEYFKKGMDIGKEKLDPSYFQKGTDEMWNVLETRSFMRAKYNYARWAYEHGQLAMAIEQCKELLQMDAEDHQEVRYLLYRLYIETSQYKQAKRVLQTYPEEYSIHYVYSQLLLEYLMHGISSSLYRFLEQAMAVNPYVVSYLIGVTNRPVATPSFYQIGSREEAICYLDQNEEVWDKQPHLLQWLQTATNR